MSFDKVSVLCLVIVRVIMVVLTVLSFDRLLVLCLVIFRVILIVLTVMSLDKVSPTLYQKTLLSKQPL